MGILALALILRVAMFAATFASDPALTAAHGGDTDSYLGPAQGLVQTGKFSQQGTPEIKRTPGYPLLLALGIRTGQVEIFAIWMQILLGVAVTLLVFFTARRVSDSETVALLAAAFFAIEPVSILFTARLMSETLFAAVLGVYVWALCTYATTFRLRHALAGALALACATFVRPISFYLPIATVGLLLFWTVLDRAHWLRRTLHVLAFLLLAMGPLLLWQARNEALTGYDGLSSIREINLFKYHAAMVRATERRITLDDAQDLMTAELVAAERDDWDEGDRSTFMRTRAIEIISDSPKTYAGIFLQGMVLNLLDPGASKWLRHFGRLPNGSHALEGELFQKGLWRGLVHIGRTVPLWLFGNLALGLLLAFTLASSAWTVLTQFPRYRRSVLFLLMVTAYFVVISGAMTSSRFRHPIMPLLCILSAMGSVSLLTPLRSWVGRKAG